MAVFKLKTTIKPGETATIGYGIVEGFAQDKWQNNNASFSNIKFVSGHLIKIGLL